MTPTALKGTSPKGGGFEIVDCRLGIADCGVRIVDCWLGEREAGARGQVSAEGKRSIV